MHPLDSFAKRVEKSFRTSKPKKNCSLLGLTALVLLASCSHTSSPLDLFLPKPPKTVLNKVTASNLSLANSCPDIIFKEQLENEKNKDPYEPLPPVLVVASTADLTNLEGVPAMR